MGRVAAVPWWVILIGVGVPLYAQQVSLQLPERKPIVGINTPALSPDGSKICFSYRGDLWTVSSQGGEATRLTIHDAHDAYPRWSPDGKWIAFASDRYPSASMNYDIFVIPAAGGEPRRLTYHTSNEYPFDWSPDGKKLLLQAIRQGDAWQAIELDVASGRTRALTRGRALVRYAVYSPDGKRIAYCRCARTGNWWRPLYHGSANMDIWLSDLSDGSVQRLTSYDGMDMWPLFSSDGNTVYYVSDVLTPGAPNLVAASIKEKRPVSLTRYPEGSVTWPGISRDGTAIVYVHSGELYIYSMRDHRSRKVTVYAPTDSKVNRLQRMTLTNGASELEIAPDGKTAAVVVRGDIWAFPTDGRGEARRLTADPANDYDFVWSPDGTRIAFVSDRKGAFGVYIVDVKTLAVQEIATSEHDAGSPQWSPDGKRLAYLSSGPAGGLYIAEPNSPGSAYRVAASSGNNRFGVGITNYSWSPDGRWLAFSRRDVRNTTDIWVVPAAGGDAVNVTMTPGSNENPRWTSDGQNLLFASTRDRLQGADLYVLSLQKPSSREGRPGGADEQLPSGSAVLIDFEEIDQRARRLTTTGVTAYEVSPDGQTIYGVTSFGGGPDLFAVSLRGGPIQRVTTTGDIAGVPRFAARASGRFWCLVAGGAVRSYAQQGPSWTASSLSFEARLEVDRESERRQAFREFWRSLKSGFYDPKMHGLSWDRVRERYEPLLEGVDTVEEFAFFVLAPMAGELNASHAEVSPRVTGNEPSVADLGLEFDEEYAGPGVRVSGSIRNGPNEGDGPRIRSGEYILRVDGKDITWGETLWTALAGRAGKETELLVNSEPKVEGARSVKLTPVTPERIRDLQYEQEVRNAQVEVARLSDRRIAYVRVRAMDMESVRGFERDLWGKQADAEGLILDIRDNGGGSTHDQILAQLARVAYGGTRPRDGETSTQPWRVWNKPIVLLVNENSASDAEVFAMGFRRLGLGTIIGARTPGYVIGTYSATLQDGTPYRIPMWGWFTADGQDLENVGVTPDIVAEGPAEALGSPDDHQLHEAVRYLLSKLPKR